MLPEQMTELLTAFVDGELGPHERKAAMKLLEHSSEARELLRQLQENAHRVKQLPRRKVEPSLVDEIVRAIEESKAQPLTPSVRPQRRRRWLPYVVATMAASLLIAVIGLTYWNSMIAVEDKGPQIVVNPPPKPEPTPEPEPIVTPPKSKVRNPLLAQITEGVYKEFAQPLPVDAPLQFAFRDLQKGSAASGQLTYQLNQEKAVQFDVTVKNNKTAINRLKDVLKDRGITLVTESAAAKKLDAKSQAKVEYLVYAENLNPGDVAKLMNELSESFVVGMANNQVTMQSPYQQGKVTPLAKDDKQKLAKLLGVESLDSASGKSGKTKGERAVVLLSNAGTLPSQEVRQFVNQRRQPQAGTMQVLIRIRQE